MGKIYRKAQGLPLNTVILALLGLAVMGLLFYAITGKLGGFIKATSECPGRCVPYQTLGAPYTAESREGCVQDIEIENSGSFVQKGTKGGELPKKCDTCCLRMV